MGCVGQAAASFLPLLTERITGRHKARGFFCSTWKLTTKHYCWKGWKYWFWFCLLRICLQALQKQNKKTPFILVFYSLEASQMYKIVSVWGNRLHLPITGEQCYCNLIDFYWGKSIIQIHTAEFDLFSVPLIEKISNTVFHGNKSNLLCDAISFKMSAGKLLSQVVPIMKNGCTFKHAQFSLYSKWMHVLVQSLAFGYLLRDIMIQDNNEANTCSNS